MFFQDSLRSSDGLFKPAGIILKPHIASMGSFISKGNLVGLSLRQTYEAFTHFGVATRQRFQKESSLDVNDMNTAITPLSPVKIEVIKIRKIIEIICFVVHFEPLMFSPQWKSGPSNEVPVHHNNVGAPN